MTRKTYLRVQVAALCLIVGLLPVGVMAVTPAGTQIQTTSTATYSATDGRVMPTSTSNTVVTTVGQGAGVTVSPATDSKTADAGKTADFALTVANTGNASDTFDLTASSANSWTVAIYRDDNGDGTRQSTETTIASNTGALSAGGTFKCFVTVTVPSSGSATSDTVTFTAKSHTDAAKSAASTLTTQKTSTEPTTGAYIQTWLVNGTYPNTDSATRLSKDYLGGETTVSPLDGEVSGGKTWFKASATTEILDLKALFGTTYCAGYTAAYVYSPTAQTVGMWMGSDDGIKVWMNGTVVWENNAGRACVLDQDKTTVSLKQGWNKMLVKISQGKGDWKVAVKLCDPNGNAVPGLVYDIRPAASDDSIAPVISSVVVTPSTTSCELTWTTNEPSSTLADYGTTASLGQSRTDTALTTSHSLTLTGLTANTNYYVKVGSSDAVGNTAWDGPTAFKTTSSSTPPPSNNPYIVTWLLNGHYKADRSVRMTTDYIGGESAAAPLEGNTAGGKTWARASARSDTMDLGLVYGGPLGCAGYMFSYVYSASAQSASLQMGSDDGIKAWVNGTVVWTNDTYRSYIADQDKVAIKLNQGWNRLLVKVTQGGSGWVASVKVCDSAGKALSGVAFDTKPGGSMPPPADTTAPVISNSVATPSTTSCVLAWDTSEPATTLVNYGTTSALGQTKNDTALASHHSVTLTGLTEGTTYYVNVGGADAAGNTGWYGVKTFTTTVTPPPTPDPDPQPATSPYIKMWLLNGYYSADRTVRMTADYIGGEAASAPLEGDTAGGKTWTKASTQTDVMDLGAFHGGPLGCAGYMFSYVYSASAQSANLQMGSDDGIKAWVNGTVVWTNDTYRSYIADQDKVAIKLNQGWNRLLVKVTQGGSGWVASVKVCDSAGKALSGVAFDTKPGGSTPPPADTTAPAISNVAATPGDTTCIFEWDTDEPASSMLDYGTTTALGTDLIDPDLATHHSITLTEMTPGTTYYVNLGSSDAAGNVAWYGMRSITTTSSGGDAPAPALSAYIQDWLVNGYYKAASSVRMTTDYIGGEVAAAPKAGDVSGGKTWNKVHTSTTTLDLGSIFRYPTGCAGYAYTNVYSPAAQSAQLWMGSDDGIKVWVNGTVVWTKDTWRSMIPDQDKVPIQLRQGWNRLLVKVTNGGSGWTAIIKVCDSAGRQLSGVAYVP